MRYHDLNRLILSLFFSVLWSGCIMYVPDAATRGTREKRATISLPSIVPGQTTKADVYLLLGEPDDVSGNQLVYRWRRLKFLLLVPGGYHAGGFSVHKGSKLVVTFDDRGIVLEQRIEDDLDWTPLLL